jgi:SWI/SNF-related matrix-associated actin-dependent regulator of chromatin subfamily A-like protein 1
MKITFQNNRFVAQDSYAQKDLIKHSGFRAVWEGGKFVCWATDNVQIARRFAEYADESAAAKLAESGVAAVSAVVQSRATTSSTVLPVPEGLKYYPYQVAGIEYAMARPNVLVADEMGVGKTIQAIGVINTDATIKKVLIVAPVIVKINWMRELEKWLVRPASIGLAYSSEAFPATDIVVINWEILKKFSNELHAQQWDLLVIDEAHRGKNRKAQCTQEIFGDWKTQKAPVAARRRIFLTGTPILNKPVEMWNMIRCLDPNGLGRNWERFVTRYCAGFKEEVARGKMVWNVSGSSNAQELQTLLRNHCMIRRLKSEVLLDLPPKIRRVVELNQNEDGVVAKVQRAIDAENAAFASHEDKLAKLEAEVELAKAGSDADYARAVAALDLAQKVAFEDIAEVRHAVGLAKVDAVIDYVEQTLAESAGKKIIVFAHHKDVIAKIVAAFPEITVKITGDDSAEQKDAAAQAFQNNPNIRLVVASIHAAGVGLNLQAANHVIFAELVYVPGLIAQAEDRAHRNGQKDTVNVEHLVLTGSLDARIAKIIVRKMEVAYNSLDRKEETVAPNAPAANKPMSKTEQLAAEGAAIPEAARDMIHDGLKKLSAVDGDRARNINGIGFSKIDTNIGNSLAAASRLSAKQAALGLRLINKYRKQLPGLAVEVKELIAKFKFLEELN